ncbi:hypothetical protein [Desulfoluna butyratoxydans]|uniref:Uncharacterized protein n=1 Tax=Desulfoluna butyratoxydans TaxID=231438 RepID=A0A4U8YRN0_9BACT|nr:hypothetical protein [Desulfoluna butyratoxydans]VFQ46541.1 hypothetical protein MSL71_42080 [Desulfoluna butyratoxydans]
MTTEKNETADGPKPKKRKKKILLPIAVVLLIAGLGAGGWFGYTTFFKSGYPRQTLEYVDLDDSVLKFSWARLPDVYHLMVDVNAEMALMKNEIKRIRRVGKAYPRQEKIVASEIKRWERSVQKLSGQLRRFQGQVEALYVTFRVNPEKGQAAIREKGPALASALQEAVNGVRSQTAALGAARVAPTGIKGVIAQIKNRFFH